ncbi:MAG: hypothetical protein ABW171_02595 [Steroidobacter sp.]
MRNKLGTILSATETRVVLALLALLALVDIGLRLTDSRLSGNLAHVEEIPEIVGAAGQPDRKALLVLGNSLTNNGVAPEVVSARLPNVSLAKITPDATGLWDWQCLLDHQVVERSDVQFDTLVLGFAWHLLSDQSRVDASRLGALYCQMGDLGRASHIGLHNSGDIGEFLAAKVLRTYALRDTLRNRLFQVGVPSYIEFTQTTNAAGAGAGAAEKSAQATEAVKYTYETFTALLNRLKSKGTRVIVVAMPVRQDYELDSQLISLHDRGALEVVDLRKLPGIGPTHYLDGMHLNPTGQQILSRALADHLAAELLSAT